MEINEPAPKLYKQYMSVSEYLEFDRMADERHEYIDGEVFRMERAYEPPSNMAGARLRHVKIVSRLQGKIFQQLSGCEVLTNDLRVAIDTLSAYFYPDLIILCGKAQLQDRNEDVLLNPDVVIEVLSKGTKDYDLGFKSHRYMENPAIKEIAFVDSNAVGVTIQRKKHNNLWEYEKLSSQEDIFRLPSVGVTIGVREIYEGIDLLSRS